MPTLKPTSEDTRVYECCVMYAHPLSQKEEADLLKEIEGLFKEADATQIEKDIWGRRGLAYTIKKHDEANFVVYYYEMAPEKLRELDRELRILPGVLRHMFVIPPKGYQLVKFSETYDEWKKSQEDSEEKESQKREEEIKKRVAAKAKRQARKVEEEKQTQEKAAPLEKEKLSAELDKLISDDELDI